MNSDLDGSGGTAARAGYKSQAHRVREDARARLLALRQSRAHRKADSGNGTRDAADKAASSCLDDAVAVPEAEAKQPPQIRHDTDPSVQAASPPTSDLAAASDPLPTPPQEMDSTSLAPAPIQMAVSGKAQEVARHASRAAEMPTAEAPTQEKSGLADADDLHSLPGAGPGLVWVFNQVGIVSLRDLAKAEASDLSPRLGLIAELIDLESWIAYARKTAGG